MSTAAEVAPIGASRHGRGSRCWPGGSHPAPHRGRCPLCPAGGRAPGWQGKYETALALGGASREKSGCFAPLSASAPHGGEGAPITAAAQQEVATTTDR